MKTKLVLFISLFSLSALVCAQEPTGANIIVKEIVPAVVAAGAGATIFKNTPAIVSRVCGDKWMLAGVATFILQGTGASLTVGGLGLISLSICHALFKVKAV